MSPPNQARNATLLQLQQKAAGNTCQSFFASTNNNFFNKLAHIRSTDLLKSSLPLNFAAKYQDDPWNRQRRQVVNKYVTMPISTKTIYHTRTPSMRQSEIPRLIRHASVQKLRNIPDAMRQTEQVIYEGNKKTVKYKITPERVLRPDQLIPFYLIHKNEPRVTVSFFR